MTAAAALGFALATYTVGFLCGCRSRWGQLSQQITRAEAERDGWREVAGKFEAEGNHYRRGRDRCREFLNVACGKERPQ